MPSHWLVDVRNLCSFAIGANTILYFLVHNIRSRLPHRLDSNQRPSCMKLFQILFTVVWLLMTSQSHAGPWEDLKPYVVTDETPIVFSPDNSTLVLEDPSGDISVEEALARKDEFKTPKEMGSIDARKHYWIMQKVSSRLDVDKNLRLDGFWIKINTYVIASDNAIFALKPAGLEDGKYAFLSDLDPALPSSAKVPSREALFTLRSGEGLSLLSNTKAFSGFPPRSFVLTVVDNEQFLETRRFGLYVEGVLLGVLLALAIFGWYSYFANKDRAGLFYGTWISFAFFTVFSLVSQDGQHLMEFVVNTYGTYIGEMPLAFFLFLFSQYGQIIFYFLFSSAFLQTAKYSPKTQNLVYLLSIYLIAQFAAMVFWNHNIAPSLWFIGNAVIPVIVFIGLYRVAFQRYRQGMRIAMFWMIAAVPYLIFRLIFVSGVMGFPSVSSFLPESGFSVLLQNNSTFQAIGLCGEALIMALAVISRNVWVQKELAESIDAQKTLVEGQNKVLEETVAERTKELTKSTKELAKSAQELAVQHQELDEAHQLVVSSVNYASRLQRGQLPRQMRIDGRFASFASIWEPRDTIGGDLYWLSSSQNQGPFVLCVADCTGHGVPGAMLSLLVSNSLERIYANDTTEDPATALMSLDHYVRTGLNQDRADSESDDGCDAAVLRIDREKQTIEFAGAKLGLFQVNADGDVTRHQAARCSLGYQDAIDDKDKPEVQVIRYQAGDVFAVVTDGLTDQIGGTGNVKLSYGYKRFETIFKANCSGNAQSIVDAVRADYADWQGAQSRRDDVTAVFFKL
jgi:serine phosphatase RsbU (regulator of sigma subunit)